MNNMQFKFNENKNHIDVLLLIFTSMKFLAPYIY